MRPENDVDEHIFEDDPRPAENDSHEHQAGVDGPIVLDPDDDSGTFYKAQRESYDHLDALDRAEAFYFSLPEHLP